MTWAIVMLILMSLVKIVLTCLPTGVIEWLLGKFEVHAKLSGENASLSLDGKRLEGAEKQKVIDQFNEAILWKNIISIQVMKSVIYIRKTAGRRW